jgi:hypothetical protein
VTASRDFSLRELPPPGANLGLVPALLPKFDLLAQLIDLFAQQGRRAFEFRGDRLDRIPAAAK